MTRLSKSHIAITLFCFATSGTAFAASKGDEIRQIVGTCVNVQTSTNAMFGLGGRVSGGGIVLESLSVSPGADKAASRSVGMRRLEPLSVTFNSISDFRALGGVLAANYKATPALNVVDVVSFSSAGPIGAVRYVRPWLSEVTVPELPDVASVGVNFGAVFIPELIEFGANVPCVVSKGAVANYSRVVLDVPGLNATGLTRVGPFKISFPPLEVPTGLDLNIRTFRPGVPAFTPVTLYFRTAATPDWANWSNWFQQTAQGRDTRRTLAIRMLDRNNAPVVSIVLYDAVPQRILPQVAGDDQLGISGLEVRFSRAEIM